MENRIKKRAKRDICRLIRLSMTLCFFLCLLLASVVTFPVYIASLIGKRLRLDFKETLT